MGLFGTSVHELEKRIVELRKKTNNLPQQLNTVKNTNKGMWRDLCKEAKNINTDCGKIIMRGILDSAGIERVSRVAQEATTTLKRLGD